MIEAIKVTDRFSLFFNQNIRLNDKNTDLFNRFEFHSLHTKKFKKYFHVQWVDIHRKESYGEFHLFEREDGLFTSPGAGSYGGFYFNSTLSFQEKELFFNSTVGWIGDYLKPKQIQCTLAPEIYNRQEHACVVNFFHRSHFKLKRAELNYSIVVEQPFESKIDRGNKKRLARAVQDGLKFVAFEYEDWKNGFQIIAENREKKGYPLTMSESALDEMFRTFPQSVFGYGVEHEGRLIAGAITMLVNSTVMYVFMWGEALGSESLSPVTFLASNLYQICLQKNVKVLDLGTSTLDSVPNYGLIAYKTNLGAEVSSKFYVERVYE